MASTKASTSDKLFFTACVRVPIVFGERTRGEMARALATTVTTLRGFRRAFRTTRGYETCPPQTS